MWLTHWATGEGAVAGAIAHGLLDGEAGFEGRLRRLGAARRGQQTCRRWWWWWWCLLRGVLGGTRLSLAGCDTSVGERRGAEGGQWRGGAAREERALCDSRWQWAGDCARPSRESGGIWRGRPRVKGGMWDVQAR